MPRKRSSWKHGSGVAAGYQAALKQSHYVFFVTGDVSHAGRLSRPMAVVQFGEDIVSAGESGACS
eukprot:1840263-Lingulodinium_polyedra.AAC.1